MFEIDPKKSAEKKKIRMEMILKDSDFMKNQRTIAQLEMEAKDLKRKKSQIEMQLSINDEKVKKLKYEQMTMQAEIRKLKSTFNMLG